MNFLMGSTWDATDETGMELEVDEMLQETEQVNMFDIEKELMQMSGMHKAKACKAIAPSHSKSQQPDSKTSILFCLTCPQRSVQYQTSAYTKVSL